MVTNSEVFRAIHDLPPAHPDGTSAGEGLSDATLAGASSPNRSWLRKTKIRPAVDYRQSCT